METVEDLGRKIKAKYPGQYDDLSDAEVGRRVKEKYPGQYDDFVEAVVPDNRAEYLPATEASVLSPTVFADAQPEPITAGDDQTLYRSLSVVLWLICAGLVLGSCSASSGGGVIGFFLLGIGSGFAASVLWKKANEAYEHEAKEIRLKTDIKRNQIAYKAEVLREQQAESDARRNLELASKRQDTNAQTELVNQKGLALQDHLLDKAKENNVDLPTYLAVEYKRAFNQADLENEVARMREQVRLAIIAKHFSNHQMISLISEQLDTLYLRIEEIQQADSIPEGAKRRMIEDREEYIAALKGDKREREKRLLEAHNGGDV